MSFFSSLALFYPSTPPVITAPQLCAFADDLRATVGVKADSEMTLELKYGESIDQDLESTTGIDWDESGLIGTYKTYEWDGQWQWGRGEPRPAEVTEARGPVYRSFMRVGWLMPDVSQRLKRQDANDITCGFWPDSLCISIDPFCPTCLGDDAEQLLCVGLVAVTFSGNGYFSWGVPWDSYAEQYKAAESIREAMRIARSHFPVESSEIIPKVEKVLGERFLNRAYYEPGDWVLTPSESG